MKEKVYCNMCKYELADGTEEGWKCQKILDGTDKTDWIAHAFKNWDNDCTDYAQHEGRTK